MIVFFPVMATNRARVGEDNRSETESELPRMSPAGNGVRGIG